MLLLLLLFQRCLALITAEKTETVIYHVWEDENEGEVKTKEVEPTKDSLVDGDAFIVDIGHTLYVWVGSGARMSNKR